MSENKAVSLTLERQVKHLQFRIQQEISVTDEEIQLLADKLTEYKSEIVHQEEAMEKLKRQIEEIKEMKSGEKKRFQVSRAMEIANMKAEHHSYIQQLREQYAKEIDQLQSDFEEMLEKFSHASDAKIENQFKSVHQEIDTLRDTISRNTTLLTKRQRNKDPIEQETKEHCTTINNSLIIELRNLVNARNLERIENLKLSKEKLNECIMAIEEMENIHQSDLYDRKKTLQHIDKKYQTELRKLNQAHDHKIRMLHGHLSEAEKRTAILQRAAHRLEQSNQRQLHETMKEIDMMSLHEGPSAEDYAQVEEEKAKVEALKEKKRELQSILQNSEAALEEVRAENNATKKRIAHAKHAIRFAARRAQNGI